MYPNLTKPFIDYTNAQVETLTRFAKSPEIAELTRSSIENFWQLVQESQSRLIQSRGFVDDVRTRFESRDPELLEMIGNIKKLKATVEEVGRTADPLCREACAQQSSRDEEAAEGVL
ncbi:MAG TPA: hypothetical protein VLD83_02270 [Candidatus Binatia bacterium]|nr:hypothetical protein [Candidatus Binatia bacterium]